MKETAVFLSLSRHISQVLAWFGAAKVSYGSIAYQEMEVYKLCGSRK
jgi:hypothetical protein